MHHWLLRNRFKIRDYCIAKVFQYFYHSEEKKIMKENKKIPLKFISMQEKHIYTKQNHESIKRFICYIVHIGITQLSPEQIEIFRMSLEYFIKCVKNWKQYKKNKSEFNFNRKIWTNVLISLNGIQKKNKQPNVMQRLAQTQYEEKKEKKNMCVFFDKHRSELVFN